MTIIYFLLILGVTVMLHEFGHYLMAKKAGIYVYEFSIGMGPRLFKWTRPNNETEYSIRLLPIGGFVQLAGEDNEDANDENIPKEKLLQNKTMWQKFTTMVAGVTMNFILALVLLFVVGLFNGYINTKPIVGDIVPDSPAMKAGLKTGDLIESVNGKFTNNNDKLMLEMIVNKNETVNLKIKRNGEQKTITIHAEKEQEEGQEIYKCGFGYNQTQEFGFIAAIKYAFTKFFSLVEQMIFTILYLFTGVLSIKNLSGPVGIYVLVGKTAKAGLINLVYLMGYISLNVGFINLLPFPAFDGGRILFLIIEKITGKPVNPRVENTIHAIGFVLLMALMVFITFNDVTNLIRK